MSWRCSGRSNAELVTNLANAGIIKSTAVISAMRAVDRGFYAPAQPYQDAPQTIGYNATISAPHMHGYALEWLAEHLRPGSTALDVGCGSGYLTAVMAEMCGSCHGIDHIEGLVALSRENILKGNPSLLDEGRATLRVRDGFQGLAECGPYDAIHVGAAAPSLPPALVAQHQAHLSLLPTQLLLPPRLLQTPARACRRIVSCACVRACACVDASA